MSGTLPADEQVEQGERQRRQCRLFEYVTERMQVIHVSPLILVSRYSSVANCDQLAGEVSAMIGQVDGKAKSRELEPRADRAPTSEYSPRLRAACQTPDGNDADRPASVRSGMQHLALQLP